ncbi:MAG TPA: hypothetical protein VN753_10515 [Terracidiphilus sp.]|nr:hypothetical protein [Terracidiphilus sp.]
MRKSPWLVAAFGLLSLAVSARSASAEKLQVNVLYRQDSDVMYHAVVPGYSGPNADITGACTLDPDPANCPAPQQASNEPIYTLVGTTLSLGLPDGRIAVVNCVSRHSANGNFVNRHSCGMPLGERAEAEFTGQSAKLSWTLGSKSNKTDSEVYKVVALLAKPGNNNQVAANQVSGRTQ